MKNRPRQERIINVHKGSKSKRLSPTLFISRHSKPTTCRVFATFRLNNHAISGIFRTFEQGITSQQHHYRTQQRFYKQHHPGMIIDAICLIIGLYGFWVGYSKGIIQTVLTAASYLLGAMAAAKFSPTVADMLTSFFHAPATVMLPAGFLLTFILTLILFRMLANGLEGMLEAVNINFINQVMGGFISMLFFIFIFSTLVVFADSATMIDDDTKETSLTYKMLTPMPDAVWKLTKNVWPVFTEFYHHTLEAFDQINTKVERHEDDTFFDVEEDETDEEAPEDEEYETDERASDRPWRY